MLPPPLPLFDTHIYDQLQFLQILSLLHRSNSTAAITAYIADGSVSYISSLEDRPLIPVTQEFIEQANRIWDAITKG